MNDQPDDLGWTMSEAQRASVCLSIPRLLLQFRRQIRWIVTLSVILIRFHWCVVSLEIHIYRLRCAIEINSTFGGSLDISWLMTYSFIPVFAGITHLRANRNGIKYKTHSGGRLHFMVLFKCVETATHISSHWPLAHQWPYAMLCHYVKWYQNKAQSAQSSLWCSPFLFLHSGKHVNCGWHAASMVNMRTNRLNVDTILRISRAPRYE